MGVACFEYCRSNLMLVCKQHIQPMLYRHWKTVTGVNLGVFHWPIKNGYRQMLCTYSCIHIDEHLKTVSGVSLGVFLDLAAGSG